MMGGRLDPAIKARAIRMRENGATFRAIANALGVSKGTLSYWFTPGLREKKAATKVKPPKATRKPRHPWAKPKAKPRTERKEPKRHPGDVSPVLAMRIEERVRRRLEGP